MSSFNASPAPHRQIETTFKAPSAMLPRIAEALNHVASTVFEVDDDWSEEPADVRIRAQNRALRDAAKACLSADANKATAEVGLTKEEVAVVPEALNHVLQEVYDGEGEIADVLHEVAEQIAPRAGWLNRSR